MAIKKNIGKNTLGDGNKMQVDLRTYNRSTHDLSFAWRNTQGVGTLVPCCKLLALPGDTADIDIDAKVLTHPTVGPLFGSYKLQVDFFVAPIRLYNAMLHNNALNIGLDMSKVKLPIYRTTLGSLYSTTNPAKQISPSCILAYLGQRGYGAGKPRTNTIKDTNAVPLLAYLDIFKNYYANKQEENYYYLAQDFSSIQTQFDAQTRLAISADNTKSYYYVTGGSLALMNTTEDQAKSYTYVFRTLETNLSSMQSSSKEIEYTFEEVKAYCSSAAVSQTTFLFQFNNVTDGTGMPVYEFIEAKNTKGLSIKTAQLTELDELREELLGAGTNQVIINQQGVLVNGENSDQTIQYLADLWGTETIRWKTQFDNQGLLLKTHQSDIFTNWINTEWIDGENGISAITAIDTSGDSFTLDSLNLAKKVYDMLNRIAVSGGSYRDWIETVYTSDYTIHAETPIYEGGMSDEIVFEAVVSNSATADEPLGTLAGRGTLGGKRKGGKLHIKINEPSYIIGICSITPRVDYSQGNDFDCYLQTMNDLHKPQLDGIGYEDLLERQFAWWRETPEAAKPAIGKTVAWINYMTNYNKTYGHFAAGENEAFMCLNRTFESQDNKTVEPINATTYINPEDYNFTFAETSLSAQNFWVQLGFGIKMRRVMSAKQIPNL